MAVFGFILLNITFLFDFLYQNIVRRFVTNFLPLDLEANLNWFPFLMHGSFVVIIGLISWFIFQSKLKVLYKAIYMVVPVAVVLATLGILFYRWPTISYFLGGFLCIGTLYYFYCTKQPWLYYYTVILVGLALAVFTLLGGEI